MRKSAKETKMSLTDEEIVEIMDIINEELDRLDENPNTYSYQRMEVLAVIMSKLASTKGDDDV